MHPSHTHFLSPAASCNLHTHLLPQELLTVIASVLILGDTLTTRNASGLLLCLVGIGYYTYVKQAEPAGMPDHTTPPMRRPPTPVVEVCELPPAPEADGSGYDEEGRDEEGRDGA